MAIVHTAFNPNKVDFLGVTPTKMGVNVPLGWDGSKSKPLIQTPKMRLPFGFRSGKWPDSNILHLAFLEKGTAFEAALVELDARIEKYCEAHIKELFPTVKDAANKCCYSPLVEDHEKHTSKVRTKVSVKEGEVATPIVDTDGNPLPWEALKANAQVTVIMSLSYVWAAQTKTYGVSPWLEMVRVHAGSQPLGFVDDPSEPAQAAEPIEEDL